MKTYLQTHRGVNRKWEILIPSMEMTQQGVNYYYMYK